MEVITFFATEMSEIFDALEQLLSGLWYPSLNEKKDLISDF